MIDFTNLPKKNKTYAGANGSKISVLYNGEQYMLKFPAIARKNQELSYTNGCFSEYLGCQIFKSVGIPVQETLLGTYTKNGKEKEVEFQSGSPLPWRSILGSLISITHARIEPVTPKMLGVPSVPRFLLSFVVRLICW